MDIHDQLSQPQSGEEMVKRIMSVAELLAKGTSAKSTHIGTEAPQTQTKTQETEAGVSSIRRTLASKC